MESEADPVIAACEAEWNKFKSDCSGFAKAVARRLGISLSGQANSMIDALENKSDLPKVQFYATER
jgi:hypothetical protein